MGCQIHEGKGFTVFYLEGDWYSMGLFFGQAIKARFRGSPLEYYLESHQRVANHALQGYPKLLRTLSRWAIKYLLFLPIALGTYKEDREFLKGTAHGLGVSSLDLLFTYSSADAFNFLASFLTRLSRTAIPQVPVACSSFVAWGEATQDGSLYHGRNLDFAGGPRWSDKHIVIVLKPTQGIPSITVSGDGVYISGVSSTNAEGLSMSLHLNFTRDINLLGRNILTLASKAISQARNLEDAVEILSNNKRISGWTFILSHAPSKKGLLLELSGNRSAKVEAEKDWLVYSNCYLSRQLRETEYAPTYTWVEYNYSRYYRLKALLQEHRGSLDPALGTKILGDRLDPTCQKELALGSVVGAMANVSSVLFCPEKDRLWMALGPIPPNGAGRYIGLSLGDLFDGKAPTILEEYSGNPLPQAKKEAVGHYSEALRLWDEEMDLRGAIQAINRAIRLQGIDKEPLFFMVRGLLLAKAGEYESAQQDFQVVLNSFLSPYRKAQALLWTGRLADLRGKRQEALEIYREVLSRSSWLDITRAAWQGIKKPYSVTLLKRMDVDLLTVDYIDY